jgi:DNA-binding LacI/PurR family transcriptional regulator
MPVITGNKIPLYSQIAQTIKHRVRTGIYKSGDVLPSVRAMCKEFGVSVKAVHQAVHTLEETGIVTTHPGKGMMVTDEDGCRRAAIFFGFIHPYVSSMGFHRDVLEYVDEAFSERSNFAVVRSSKDNPALERDIAEHLIANGVKGLILWPTTDDPNGEFFGRIAQKIPVVLVDRLLAGADLPTVVLDYFACGREICETLLAKKNKKRLLVLMDNLRISSYQAIAEGIESMAGQLGRSNDLTVVQLPITRLIQKWGNSDFTEVSGTAEKIERLINDGHYDAVFCTQDDFIEHALVQTGMMDKFSAVQVATFRGMGPNERTIRYAKLGCLEWFSNLGQVMTQAADLVQRWVLSRQMPKEVFRLKLKLVEPRELKV